MKPACLAAIMTVSACAGSVCADDGLRAQVLQALASQPVKHFHFVQEKKLAVLNKPLITEGELTVNGNDAVHWQIQQPYQIRYDIEGDRIRETDAQGTRDIATGNNPLAAALNEAMAATFSGQWSAQEQIASVSALGIMGDWQLQIVPRNSELQKLVRSIVVHGSENHMQDVFIAESNGDSTHIRLQPLP